MEVKHANVKGAILLSNMAWASAKLTEIFYEAKKIVQMLLEL